jgi:hypothetical protein
MRCLTTALPALGAIAGMAMLAGCTLAPRDVKPVSTPAAEEIHDIAAALVQEGPVCVAAMREARRQTEEAAKAPLMADRRASRAYVTEIEVSLDGVNKVRQTLQQRVGRAAGYLDVHKRTYMSQVVTTWDAEGERSSTLSADVDTGTAVLVSGSDIGGPRVSYRIVISALEKMVAIGPASVPHVRCQIIDGDFVAPSAKATVYSKDGLEVAASATIEEITDAAPGKTPAARSSVQASAKRPASPQRRKSSAPVVYSPRN